MSVLKDNTPKSDKRTRIQIMKDAVAGIEAECHDMILAVMAGKESGRHKFDNPVYITTDGDGVYIAEQMYREKDESGEYIMFEPQPVGAPDECCTPMSLAMISADGLLSICEELIEEGY